MTNPAVMYIRYGIPGVTQVSDVVENSVFSACLKEKSSFFLDPLILSIEKLYFGLLDL